MVTSLILSFVQHKVSTEMNESMHLLGIDHEISDTLFQNGHLKVTDLISMFVFSSIIGIFYGRIAQAVKHFSESGNM